MLGARHAGCAPRDWLRSRVHPTRRAPVVLDRGGRESALTHRLRTSAELFFRVWNKRRKQDGPAQEDSDRNRRV